MNSKQKKALYESIMRQVSKTVKKALNEMSPEVYRNAADRREAQINALPTYLKNKLGVNRNAPKDLRAHADKIQAKLDAERKAEEERIRIEQERKERERQAYLASIREATKEKFGTSKYPIIEILTLISEDDNNLADYDENEETLKQTFIDALMDLDLDYFKDYYTDQDYQSGIWDNFDEDELEVLLHDIIPEIIKNNFTYIDLLSSIYNDSCYAIYCNDDGYVSELFDEDAEAAIIETAEGNMIYVKDNSIFGHVISFKDLKKKFILAGDFRGERDEVSDYAYNDPEGDLVAIYYQGDYALFGNNKSKLNEIEQELWDNHIMACGGIEKI